MTYVCCYTQTYRSDLTVLASAVDAEESSFSLLRVQKRRSESLVSETNSEMRLHVFRRFAVKLQKRS